MRLNEEIIEDIIKHIKAGNYAKDVVDYVGIDEVTYYNWKKDGKRIAKEVEKGANIDDYTEYQQLELKFFKSLKSAEKEAILRNVSIVQKAAIEHWQAAAWYLERRDFKKWGRKEKIDFKGKTDNKIDHVIKFVEEDKGDDES